MAMDGMTMMLKNLIGEKRLNEIFGTFDNIKNGVVQVMTALNTIHDFQKAEALKSEQRHNELCAMLASLGATMPERANGAALTTEVKSQPN